MGQSGFRSSLILKLKHITSLFSTAFSRLNQFTLWLFIWITAAIPSLRSHISGIYRNSSKTLTLSFGSDWPIPEPFVVEGLRCAGCLSLNQVFHPRSGRSQPHAESSSVRQNHSILATRKGSGWQTANPPNVHYNSGIG